MGYDNQMVFHTSDQKGFSFEKEIQKHLSDISCKNVVIDKGKWAIKWKCTKHYHRDPKNDDMNYVDMKKCITAQFYLLSFCGPHGKPHVVRGCR